MIFITEVDIKKQTNLERIRTLIKIAKGQAKYIQSEDNEK